MMKKRELIYLHGLLDRVRAVMTQHGDLTDESLESYQDLGITPTAVYQPKGEHEEAVEMLAETLSEATETNGQIAEAQ